MRYYLGVALATMSFLAPIGVAAASPSVAIHEVLFDPTGTDTGLEYISIKNIGSVSADLSGWELYPDGVGYFAFPAVTLSPGASVKVFIRGTGTNTDTSLYFSGASGNMGNSSGVVALFSSSSHSSDTIVSYVRYHKPGSSEHKTWESSAGSAGLWIVGSYVDVGSLVEGQPIVLTNESARTSGSGWSIGGSQADPAPSSSSDSQTSTGSSSDGAVVPSVAYAQPAIESKIKVYGGADISAVAGSVVALSASAEDLAGQPLEGARFLWNFGDGTYQEGRAVSHIFRYPGRYTAVVDASAGMYSASDSVNVSVVENPIIISELSPSKEKSFLASLVSSDYGGWIELYNSASQQIDISGIGVVVNQSKPFFFPAHSSLSAKSVVTIGDAVLGFPIPQKGAIRLLYANGIALSETSYDATGLIGGQGLTRQGEGFVVATATPGIFQIVGKGGALPVVGTAQVTKAQNIQHKNASATFSNPPGDKAQPFSQDSGGRLQPVALGASVSGVGSLFSLGVGAAVAFLGTLIVFVIKTLFQRYNKTNGQKQ